MQYLGKLVRFVRVEDDHPKRHIAIVTVVDNELTAPGVVGENTQLDSGTGAAVM